MILTTAMRMFGHLASRRQLTDLNIGRHIIDRALTDGSLVRVRNGWVASLSAPQDAVIAVLRGAALTGSSALRSYGIWAGDDHRIHVQVPEDSHRVEQRAITPIAEFTPPLFSPRGVVTHWSPFVLEQGMTPAWRVSLPDAISRFATTESSEQVAAVLESGVQLNRMSRRAVARIIQNLPRRLDLQASDLTFLADSGMETIVRIRLGALGLRVTQQIWIGGDRVDLVIDGWLVIELDGDAWHDPVADRIRTNRMVRAGYGHLRFGYVEVFDRWDETVATIYSLLGDHRA